MTAIVKNILRPFLDFLIPPLCLSCRSPIPEPHQLCAICWTKMTFVGEPCCTICAWPFEFEERGQLVCGPCLDTPPSFTKARFVMAYNESSRPMIIRFKHHDAPYLAIGFAKLMHHAGQDVLQNAQALIPVPLHPLRLLWRQYNQSALLARHLSILSGVPFLPSVLRKQRYTRAQEGLSREKRLKNVQKAFHIPGKKKSSVEGKVVVLIDDVWTTGSTLSACCDTLKNNGAAEIRVLTLARVLISSPFS